MGHHSKHSHPTNCDKVGQLLCTHFCEILLWGLQNSTSFLKFYNSTSNNPFSSFLLLLFLSRSELGLRLDQNRHILFSIFSFYISKHQCKKKKVNVRKCSFYLSIYPKQNWKCVSILVSWFPGVTNPCSAKSQSESQFYSKWKVEPWPRARLSTGSEIK